MKALKDKRGVVLILVLSMVALFSAMIVNFSSDEALDIELAYNFRDSIQAQYIAMAGVEAAKVILAQDNAGYDSLDEQWAEFPVFAATASTYLEGGQLTGTITDECSKFDLNSLAVKDNYSEFRKQQFKNLFIMLNIDITSEELDDLTNSIIDWESATSEVSIGGAKEEYYQSLEPPYHCKNGPMDSIEEIMLVKGMKKEYFFGTENYEGIRNFITVCPLNTSSSGKININTASETVLKGISDRFNEEVVNNIVACRPFTGNNFSCARGLDLTDSTPETTWIKNTLVVKSTRFSVDVQGVMPSGALINVKAVLERINNNPRIVYYRIY
ncbi:MAG: type II secretion system minor pseudopilin GspK [Desulfomonilia bacterium]